jgi:hypothetical protein
MCNDRAGESSNERNRDIVSHEITSVYLEEEMSNAYLAALRDTEERTAAVDTRESKVRDAANDNMTITDTKGTPAWQVTDLGLLK